MIFNLSVKKNSEDSLNRIIAISQIMNVSASSLIMKGVKLYIDKIDNVPSLIPDSSVWDTIISEMSKEQKLETNTLLFRLNQKIMESYASTAK